MTDFDPFGPEYWAPIDRGHLNTPGTDDVTCDCGAARPRSDMVELPPNPLQIEFLCGPGFDCPERLPGRRDWAKEWIERAEREG